MVRMRVLISGRVQGVFFRAYTQTQAQKLKLTGWVRNLPDGRVEAVFEGERDKVEEIIKWCWRGVPAAQVEGVEIGEIEEIREIGEIMDFTIKR